MNIINKNLDIDSVKVMKSNDISYLIDKKNLLDVEIGLLEAIVDKEPKTKQYLNLQRVLRTQIKTQISFLRKRNMVDINSLKTNINILKREISFLKSEFKIAAPSKYEESMKKLKNAKNAF